MNKSILTITILAAGLAMSACSGGGMPKNIKEGIGDAKKAADKTAEVADDASQRAAEPKKLCYWGTTKVADAEGNVKEQWETVIERIQLPPNKQVVERTTHYRKGQDAKMTMVTIEVDKDKYTLKDKEGQVEGSGTFTGDMWSWSGWTTEYTKPQIMTSEVTIEEKAFVQTSTMKGPDGAAMATKTDTLEMVEDSVCIDKLKKFGVGTLDKNAREGANDAAKKGAKETNEAIGE